jgi:hypothetical protein
LYSCPHCRAELEVHFDEWDGWLRCPVCTRPANPPVPAGFRTDRQRRVVSNDDHVEQTATGLPRARVNLDGSQAALFGRLAHTSPARLVFITGFVFSLFLALIAFLDQKATRLAIFGFSSFCFFVLLLRTRRKRIVPWKTRPIHVQGTTALKEPGSD